MEYNIPIDKDIARALTAQKINALIDEIVEDNPAWSEQDVRRFAVEGISAFLKHMHDETDDVVFRDAKKLWGDRDDGYEDVVEKG